MSKRAFLRVSSALLALLFVHYAFVVVAARASTAERVRLAKASYVDPIRTDDLTEQERIELLRVQDPNFYSHWGSDFSHGTMTTITQSVVKRLYFADFRPGVAKLKQTLIAVFAFNPLVTKDEQLELFLNVTYFGTRNGGEVRGFGAAAQTYFGKPFHELSPAEYEQLLKLLSHPNAARKIR